MNKLVFVIGMRRAGTSILRALIMQHPEIEFLEFEPHDLMYAVGTKHIKRYTNSKYHQEIIARFYNHNKYYGAKIVCNPYLSSLSWKFLRRYFPEAKFIFIKRDWVDNYNSWYNQDKKSVRGVMPKEMYKYFYDKINASFETHYENNLNNSCIITYERLVNNADKELQKVWELLNIKSKTGFNKEMKKPSNWKGETSNE